MAVAYLYMSENWFIWCKNIRCFVFSSPCITDAMGCFIFTFVCWTAVKYYFKVRIPKKWMAGIHHDVSNKLCLNFLNRWAVGVFNVLSIIRLENIFESLTNIGKTFHHYFSFYFDHRLCTEFSNTCPHIFLLLLILFLTFIESIL